ncbi:MAG: cysteine-rich small domain-containing protein [Anaerolineaceae bacterium]|nr:cysteine-rich small domain-containing protein [Anaerolineaceae bacterium]
MKKNGPKHYQFFCNRECEFFPCHPGADPEHFNCLFCYCPLYALGERCGGNFQYTEKGIKDCTNCLVPHKPENYDLIISRFSEIAEIAKARPDF